MAKKKTFKKTTNVKRILPKKSPDIPVTKKYWDELRAELKSDATSINLRLSSVDAKVDALHMEMNSKFEKVNSRFEEMNSKFQEVNSRFGEINSKFEKVNSRFEEVNSNFEKILAVTHRTNALVEAQEDRNRYVLDGYTQLFQRQEILEEKMDRGFLEIKKLIQGH
ncbi:MAG: hypothetical protein KDD38_08490 [Bdellovibrionales bacterium]|nr:hypothetical protein [Bdellovibrionales bacterium]